MLLQLVPFPLCRAELLQVVNTLVRDQGEHEFGFVLYHRHLTISLSQAPATTNGLLIWV